MPVVLIGIVIIMVDGFDLQAIGFVAPEIARAWLLDPSAFGPVFSAGLAGSMIGAMSAGPGTRRMGLRSVLALSLLLIGAGTLATAGVTGLSTLIPLRFVTGLGLGAAVPVIMSLVADNSSPRFRATLVTLALCGQPVGAILGAALCARLIPLYGWQSAFYLGGILPLLLLPAILVLPKEREGFTDEPRGVPAERGGRVADLFRGGLVSTTLLLWASAFLAVFFLYLIVSWMPSIVRGEGYSLKTSLLAISLFNFGGIVGAIAIAALVDRFGAFRVVPPALLFAGVCLTGLDSALHTLPVFLTASLLSGLAGYGGGTALGALTILLYPRGLRTTGAGWVLGVGRMGAAIGPLGAGFALSSGLHAGNLFYLAAAAIVLAALCLIALGKMRAHGPQWEPA